MLTYLIILLDDTSVSYCSFTSLKKDRRLIPIDVLRNGIIWGMKENLNVQFVYPNYPLPEEYRELVETIDHTKIGSYECGETLDFVAVEDLENIEENVKQSYIWHCSLNEFYQQKNRVKEMLNCMLRLNVMLNDIQSWNQVEFDLYKEILKELADYIVELSKQGKEIQLNLLTDRLALDHMNNCGAGDTSIVLAPDGRFYVCPAFYPIENIGSLDEGLTIPNKQLYKISHAPICRECDAYQCKRCVWLNAQLTGDCNTPSHEQCVAAHLERNASRYLQLKLKEEGLNLKSNHEIEEIDYLDPFNIVNKWK